ncbi:MAG: hypothetical protein JWO63_2113 [Frankiales bacterium]|nr:hypothetical protein [Frankiales bacterium]
MEPSDALIADLAALSDALDEPGVDLASLVRLLGESCRLAVGSYLGFSITLVGAGGPVSLSVLEDLGDPSEIRTSVMFTLDASGDHPAGSELTLYAGTPGAFVDLAADLAYVLGGSSEAVQLDRHLTPPDPGRGAAGLAAMSRENQALGILLGRGHDPERARTELRRLARADATSLDAAAQQVIDSTARAFPVERL